MRSRFCDFPAILLFRTRSKAVLCAKRTLEWIKRKWFLCYVCVCAVLSVVEANRRIDKSGQLNQCELFFFFSQCINRAVWVERQTLPMLGPCVGHKNSKTCRQIPRSRISSFSCIAFFFYPPLSLLVHSLVVDYVLLNELWVVCCARLHLPARMPVHTYVLGIFKVKLDVRVELVIHV